MVEQLVLTLLERVDLLAHVSTVIVHRVDVPPGVTGLVRGTRRLRDECPDRLIVRLTCLK